MKQMSNQKGFTLVELAIVMTIIGLLIGGVLKGQELMENARVTSTVAQVKGYEGAVTGFRDAYGALPGDIPNAASRLPNCASNCNGSGAVLGDTLIGAVGSLNADQSAVGTEPTKFWLHLLRANMVSGVTDAAMTGGAVQWGETHPSSSLGGGFTVANGAGGSVANNPSSPVGNVLILRPVVSGALTTTANTNVLSPLRAAQIDRKMDDGAARSGSVRAYGVAANCTGGGPNTNSYNETVTNKDCGLFFNLQN